MEEVDLSFLTFVSSQGTLVSYRRKFHAEVDDNFALYMSTSPFKIFYFGICAMKNIV